MCIIPSTTTRTMPYSEYFMRAKTSIVNTYKNGEIFYFQHGKDFDSIHNLIVSKCKRRGGSQPITVKNKEQVRHFYYRTWHKISKLIEPVEGNGKINTVDVV